jgi:hypothetical protein
VAGAASGVTAAVSSGMGFLGGQCSRTP